MALAAAWNAYDRVVSGTVFKVLAIAGYEEIEKTPSPITNGLPLVASPTPLVTIILAYLALVAVGLKRHGLLGPRTGPDPLWLRCLVQAHNVFLIGLSTFMAAGACLLAWRHGYSFWGSAYDPAEKDMGILVYIFYVSKLYEFLDTVIMLLKSKLQQLSFLHVYHHVSISCIWWAIAYAAPGGDAWYCVFLNSLVHMFMYTYYMLANLLSGNSAKRRKYLWWGRHLTQFQMFQFVTMMAQASYCWKYSPYPKVMSRLLFFYMQTLLALFANFYLSKHGSKNGSHKLKGTPKKAQ